MTVIAKETMLLKDTAEMQVILNKDILEKNFSVTVINKQTRKQKTYKDNMDYRMKVLTRICDYYSYKFRLYPDGRLVLQMMNANTKDTDLEWRGKDDCGHLEYETIDHMLIDWLSELKKNEGSYKFDEEIVFIESMFKPKCTKRPCCICKDHKANKPFEIRDDFGRLYKTSNISHCPYCGRFLNENYSS